MPDASLLGANGLEAAAHAALRRLWTESGDAISLQYTGTANLSKGSNITGDQPKKNLFDRASGLVEKGVRTAQRYVNDNFFEDTRQSAMDALLGGGQRANLMSSARGSWREDGALGALGAHHPGVAADDDDPDAVRMADLPLGL